TAFKPIAGNHDFTLPGEAFPACLDCQADRFQRQSGKPLSEILTPRIFETAIARLELAHFHSPVCENRQPASIRTQSRPAAPTHCQNTDRCLAFNQALSGMKLMAHSVFLRQLLQPCPVVSCMQPDSLLFQPFQPGPQQGSSFLFNW